MPSSKKLFCALSLGIHNNAYNHFRWCSQGDVQFMQVLSGFMKDSTA